MKNYLKNARPASRAKSWAFLFLLSVLIAISCDNQQPEKRQVDKSIIQTSILEDDDFLAMMTDVFVFNFSVDPEASKTGDSWKQHLTEFDKHFSTLNERYPNFHENAQSALSNKTSEAYLAFTKKLDERVRSEFESGNAKLNVVYDGESVCGRSCGKSLASTTACITGCYYSSTYCYSHGGTNCGEMRDSCIGSCCDSFCPGVSFN